MAFSLLFTDYSEIFSRRHQIHHDIKRGEDQITRSRHCDQEFLIRYTQDRHHFEIMGNANAVWIPDTTRGRKNTVST